MPCNTQYFLGGDIKKNFIKSIFVGLFWFSFSSNCFKGSIFVHAEYIELLSKLKVTEMKTFQI